MASTTRVSIYGGSANLDFEVDSDNTATAATYGSIHDLSWDLDEGDLHALAAFCAEGLRKIKHARTET